MKGNKKRKFRFPTAFTVLFIALILAAFPIMIWGVSSGDWWFPEMSALFLAVALIIIFLSGLSEKEAVNTFLEGAADLIGVVLIIGVARLDGICYPYGTNSCYLRNGRCNL